jgi:hypothetical protein
MTARFGLPVTLLLLGALLVGCGGAGPLVDPSIVPRAALEGRVVDAASGQPAAGVRVFLAGTSHRATTNGQDAFTLTGVPAGVYEIAAHQPGYAPATSTVAHRPANSAAGSSEVRLRLSTAGASDPSSASGNGPGVQMPEDLAPAAREAIETLRQRVEQLESRVALISRQVELLRDEQRGTTLLAMNEDELEAFKEFFLGDEREECELLNPGVLSFEAADADRGVVLQATTDQPLEVLNRRLGYRLRVVLDAFSVAESGRETAVLGDALVSFEPLPPSTEDIAERWRKARRAAYEGSRVHLLRAWGAGRVEDEDFTVERPIDAERRTSASLAGRSYPVGSASQPGGARRDRRGAARAHASPGGPAPGAPRRRRGLVPVAGRERRAVHRPRAAACAGGGADRGLLAGAPDLPPGAGQLRAAGVLILPSAPEGATVGLPEVARLMRAERAALREDSHSR